MHDLPVSHSCVVCRAREFVCATCKTRLCKYMDWHYSIANAAGNKCCRCAIRANILEAQHMCDQCVIQKEAERVKKLINAKDT